MIRTVALGLAVFFGLAAGLQAQDSGGVPQGQWQGGPGGSGPGRGRMGFAGERGTVGTVTAVATDHFAVKTETGESYTVYFSANTRILKQPPQAKGARRTGVEGNGERGDRTPPAPIKPAEIKVGDVITAGGELDAKAKTVGAVFILLLDPARAEELRKLEANFGKTWLMGRVTAIDGVKVTLDSGPRGAHSLLADENTTFRKRREPVTLGDIQVGDMVRAEGSIKDGAFLATSIAVMGRPPQDAEGHGPDSAPAAGPR